MSKVQFWIVTAVALLGLASTGVNIGLLTVNRGAQAEIAKRQQYVQQSVQLETLYRELVRALGELSARRDDPALRGLLQRHGINPPPAASPAPAAPPAPNPAPQPKRK